MIVDFVRSGGFAAIRLAATIDSRTLPADEAEQLQGLVDAADFFALPARLRSARPGADRFQYSVTVDTDGHRHTVQAGEDAVPPKLNPLIEYLNAAARNRAGYY
jgi:hypothetical protein